MCVSLDRPAMYTQTHTLEHKDTHNHFNPLNQMILVLMETEDTFYSINHRDHTTRHTKGSFHNTATSPLCLSFFIALSPLFLTLSYLKCRVCVYFLFFGWAVFNQNRLTVSSETHDGCLHNKKELVIPCLLKPFIQCCFISCSGSQGQYHHHITLWLPTWNG